MDSKEMLSIGRKLDVLIAISVCQLQQLTDPRELTKALIRHGLQPSEIAPVVGMTPNAVRIALHRSRQAPGTGRPARVKKED